MKKRDNFSLFLNPEYMFKSTLSWTNAENIGLTYKMAASTKFRFAGQMKKSAYN